jgi:hypothetical protein
LQAELDYNEASRYDPNTSSPSLRFSLVELSSQLSDISKKFPKTRAAAMSANLLRSIDEKNADMETEKVNLPGLPFLSKISYRNVQQIYYRVIQLDDEDFGQQRFNENYWGIITKKKYIRAGQSETTGSRATKRIHSVEVKIDALACRTICHPGQPGSKFHVSTKTYSPCSTCHVSNISYISRENHFFILHRKYG